MCAVWVRHVLYVFCVYHGVCVCVCVCVWTHEDSGPYNLFISKTLIFRFYVCHVSGTFEILPRYNGMASTVYYQVASVLKRKELTLHGAEISVK